MINQLPIYALCYFLGWLPLYIIYRKLESWVPFNLKKSSVIFSMLPLLYGMYMAAEVYRGYMLMHIVHEWLLFDIDLIVGVALWLFAVGFPPFVLAKYRTSLWLSIIGVYLYLFPMFVWVVPVVLIGMFFFGQVPVVSYGVIGGVFLVIGLINQSNSLYIFLYFCLMVYVVIKSYIDSKVSVSH